MLPQCEKGLQLAAQMPILRHTRFGGRMAIDRPPMVTQKKSSKHSAHAKGAPGSSRGLWELGSARCEEWMVK